MKYKYPRTYHVPFSPGATSDDKMLKTMENFVGKKVVITEKMDGENTTISSDYFHARSLDSRDHESRHWMKQFWSTIRHNIPRGMRICGENLYARHSIQYDALDSYFQVFNIWIDDQCLSWHETLEWCQLLELTTVPVLCYGVYEDGIETILIEDIKSSNKEGFVIRTVHGFKLDEFDKCVAKYVRKGHVQTDTHWMHSQVIPNKLKETNEI